jgi:hypothetical protein
MTDGDLSAFFTIVAVLVGGAIDWWIIDWIFRDRKEKS